MRISGIACAVVATLGLASAEAQEPGQSVSTEAVLQALQKTQQPLSIPFLLVPEGNRRFGFLTLETPDKRGEFVKVSVPVGDWSMRVARKVSSAQRQRRERKARETVERALRDFQAQPK